MKKRGLFDENKESKISRVIFKMLDPEGRGEISGDALVIFLLELGFAINPQKIKEALLTILRKDHASFKLRHDDISTLCKGDHRTNFVIKYINEEVRNERLNACESIKVDTSDIKISEQLTILNN